ncbi:MAG: imidazole glycerol phosphate synthase subunit HisF [Rhodospirillaceae bacterium]|nr:MAG: imidazole glycerol phosphate synthase subunit HisF [Rhodospirillaceae bacterium]
MLKQRIVGVLLVREGIVVQSLGFQRYLPVGKPAIAVEHLNRWGIDEIVMLDISSPQARLRLDVLMERVAPYCLVPLAAGGGIRTVDQIRDVIKSGADRVVLNTAVLDDPKLITQGADRFGAQAIIASIDAKPGDDGRYEAFVDGGRRRAHLTPAEMAKRAEDHGAGEILIQAIHRDGAKSGYDLDLVAEISKAVSVPIVVLGGVGSPFHFVEAARLPGVCGLAAGNYLHFTEHTATVAKAVLKKAGIAMRQDSYADYRDFSFSEDGRLLKRSDAELEDMLFIHYVDEVI